MKNVEPIVAPLVAEVRLALRDLVCVVRECIVNAAAVDVEIFAEMLQADRRAFNVPSRIAHAPRAVPLELLRIEFRFREPEDEIGFVSLVFVGFNTLTHADREILFVVLVEHIVFLELRGVKVYVSACGVGVSAVEKSGDHFYEIVDAVRRRLYDIGDFYVEFSAIVEECVGIEFRNLHDGFVLAPRPLEHFVFTCVGVA